MQMEMIDSAASPSPARPTLALDDKALVLPGTNSLHVSSRRGAFDLLASDIHRLHARMAPYLDGVYTEDELLRAVPSPQVAAVRDYLATLRRAGALCAEPPAASPEAGLPLERLGPEQLRGRFRIRSQAIDISLDGLWGSDTSRLCFLTPAQAAFWLSTLEGPECPVGFQTCVVTQPGQHSPATWNQRAAYARWLLHSGAVQLEATPRCQLYQLDTTSGSLERLAVIDRDRESSRIQSLPEQLGLIQSDHADQMPLVVATAGHEWFSPSMTRFGMAYDVVRDDLLRRFIVAVWLEHRPETQHMTFFRGPLGAPLGTYTPVNIAKPEVADLAIAGSRPALEARLLERAVAFEIDRRPLRDWRRIDLLTEPSESLETSSLQGILRLRGQTLLARSARVGGVHVLRFGEHRACSFLRQEAVHELLLAVAYRRYYDPSLRAEPARDHRPFADVAALGSTLRRHLTRRSEAGVVEMVTRRIRCWGVSAWAGALVAPASLAARRR